jgi:hypothetical protein
MKVTGPGLVKFMWKVDPMAQHLGTLGFWVDNAESAVCKSQGWTPISYTLREKRDYNLAWQFYKFKSIPADMGAGWIDDLDVIGGTVGASPAISSEIVDDFYLNNRSSANNRSCCNYWSRINGTPSSEKSTQYSVLQGPIIVPQPNITINIGLNPTTNVSIDISGVSGSLSNVEPNQNTSSRIEENITPPIDKTNKCEHQKCYKTINEAVSAVDNGGNVTIYEGIYNESVVVDKALRLIGRNNTTTKIVVQDQDGITVACGAGTVSIENLSIINEYRSCRRAIGINDTSKSQDRNIVIKDCSILNFAIGAKIGKSRLTFVRNKIISAMEFDNIVEGCQLCTYDNASSKGKHYLAGLWFNAPHDKFEIHNNTIELENNTNQNLYTYGIVHEGPTSDCAYDIAKTQDFRKINTTACRIMYLLGKDSADCADSDDWAR